MSEHVKAKLTFSRKWNYIIPVIIFAVFLLAGSLVDKEYRETGLLSVAAFPLFIILREITDMRSNGIKKASVYIIIFSVLVIAALVAAVVTQLGRTGSAL